jgi:hypothetical protein
VEFDSPADFAETDAIVVKVDGDIRDNERLTTGMYVTWMGHAQNFGVICPRHQVGVERALFGVVDSFDVNLSDRGEVERRDVDRNVLGRNS